MGRRGQRYISATIILLLLYDVVVVVTLCSFQQTFPLKGVVFGSFFAGYACTQVIGGYSSVSFGGYVQCHEGKKARRTMQVTSERMHLLIYHTSAAQCLLRPYSSGPYSPFSPLLPHVGGWSPSCVAERRWAWPRA